jgi:2-oxoacid:acceptor oxidoreductase gamma subunit (pyruvate/2-ketoisovalerate family)
MGHGVQAFGDYAGERSGAPIRAFTRVGDGPITSRNKVYEPDHLLVLDPTLLGPPVLQGLATGGTLLLNDTGRAEDFATRFPGHRVAVVDATGIARRHGIGSRSVVIVNTTIAGAYAKVFDIPWETVEAAFGDLRLTGNLDAARDAHEAVRIAEIVPAEPAEGADAGGPASPWGQTAEGDVTELSAHLSAPAPLLKTGAWRSQSPRYVTKLAPCSAACPAGNDVVGFVQALAREDLDEAARVLEQSTPLPAVCGRVCPAFCMAGCNRGATDGAVNVRALERWVGDHVALTPSRPKRRADRSRVAVIGGGPAGLAAAHVLADAGHEVAIHEGERRLGGVLHTGIPAHRLPASVVKKEVERLLSHGIRKKVGRFLNRDDVADIAADNDALILATGLQRKRALEVPGAELPGVQQGISFLHALNVKGDRPELGRVVVLGGGNTALDCARSAVRLGAESVTIAYRRSLEEMPALDEEIEDGEEEGVRFLLQRAPVAVVGEDRVSGVELAEVEMGEPDESGRRRPIVTERTEVLTCDTVFLALGQSADFSLLPVGWTVEDGQASAGGELLPVFLAGDVSTNAGTVAHAIGDGRRAAGRALAALGTEVEIFEQADPAQAVGPMDVRLDFLPAARPDRTRKEAPRVRTRNFSECDHGLATADEAGRCLSCGHCTQCDTCMLCCPEGVIVRTEDGYSIDMEYCKGCGLCLAECPRAGMDMVRT